MNLYLDDNSAGRTLLALLATAGHVAISPADVGLVGADDPVHFEHAIRHDLILLTADRIDFRQLHDLILVSGGRHPGLILVRADSDRRKDMKPKHIIGALRKLENAGFVLESQIVILNTWR